MKKALPYILMAAGVLTLVGGPGLAYIRHVQLHASGMAGQMSAETGPALLAVFGLFAVPFGGMLMVAGYMMRRTRILDEQDAAAAAAKRAARRKPGGRARRLHAD